MIFRIKGLNKVRGRKGQVYYYDRQTGTRIRAPYGTMEFVAEVTELRRRTEEAAAQPRKPEGSWGHLVAYYLGTSKFTTLGERTRADYLRVFDYMVKLDAMPLARMTPQWMAEFAELTYRKRKRRFANYVLAVISRAWNVGRAAGKCPHPNPVEKDHKIRKPKGVPVANRPWAIAEVEAFFVQASPPLRVGAALALWAGWREGDVCRLTSSAYNGKEIQGRQGKTDELVWLPAHSALRAVLDAELARVPRLPTAPLVMTERGGRAYSESGLRAIFFRLIRKLANEGKVGPGPTFHGLRTTLATAIAEAGGDTRDIAAALGHATEAMAVHYARHAERRRRAAHAIGLLEQPKNDVLQNKEP